MIDRRIITIALSFIAILTFVALWRLSQLPDWPGLPHPPPGAMTPVQMRGFVAPPLVMLFLLAFLGWRDWIADAPEDKRKPWRARNAFVVTMVGLLMLSVEAATLARPFVHAGLPDAASTMRIVMIFWALVMIVLSNNAPKLPWLSSRIGFARLDAEHGAKLLRFTGIAGVLAGIVVLAAALAAPMDMVMPILHTTALGTLAALMWLRAVLKRRQSH